MNNESQNPPKDTRFKKGRSGNPKGRSKKTVGQVSTGSQFRKVAKGQITIEIEGARYKTSRWDAYVRQIYNMALNKNSSAARLLDQLRRWFPGDLLPGDPITFLISEADAKL
jgi:Family of unknown function (DUF5681)